MKYKSETQPLNSRDGRKLFILTNYFLFHAQLIDIHKHYYEDVRKRAMACLEPGPKVVSRIRPTAAAAGSHSAPVREGYPHAELLLGDCFLKYGELFGANTAFGK
ncbi:unnamed protein product [Echinostoma caproni]|uniref:Uncharacterized protein n=1 Tax=Echinostoma caproni TaxID=27848 RepID=A0A183AXH1_9TREM|nr:unnamed protein product [Echinostoma caproni]